MYRFLGLVTALLLLVLTTPTALAAEDFPDPGIERTTVYYTGSCGGSMTYHGHFEADCYGQGFYYGIRSGKFRITSDIDCVLQYVVYAKYEVCTSGSSCTATSGTWQEITQQQFQNAYCP